MKKQDVLDIDWGLKPLHDKMKEMLCYVHDFCVTNGLEYCLAYGTALGAARHKGFIPWDDDVDIYMTENSYRRFKELFENSGDKNKYFFQELDEIDGLVSLTKIRMNGTTYIEPLYRNANVHQGIYIDIFILHKAPRSTLRRKIMCLANQYLVLKGLSNRRYKGKRAYIPLLAFMRLFPKNFLRKIALKCVYEYDGIASENFFDNDLRYYKKSFYPSRYVFPAKLVEFDGVSLYAPGELDTYLKWVYGDYHKLPTYEMIKRSQHAAKWDVETDYKFFINGLG